MKLEYLVIANLALTLLLVFKVFGINVLRSIWNIPRTVRTSFKTLIYRIKQCNEDRETFWREQQIKYAELETLKLMFKIRKEEE